MLFLLKRSFIGFCVAFLPCVWDYDHLALPPTNLQGLPESALLAHLQLLTHEDVLDKNQALNGHNKASRIYLVLRALANHPERTPLKDAWLGALGVNAPNSSPEVEMLIVHEGIHLVARELDLVEEEISLTGFPPQSLVALEFKKIRLALGQNTSGTVANIKSHLDAGVLKVVETIAVASVDDSLVADTQELEALQAALDSLEEALKQSSSIPYRPRSAFLERIREMRSALLMIKINGTNGVSLTMEGLMGAFYIHSESLENGNPAEVAKVKSEVRRVIAEASVVASVSEIIKLGVSESFSAIKTLLGG